MIPKDATDYRITRDGMELRVIRRDNELQLVTPDDSATLAEVALYGCYNEECNYIVYIDTYACEEIGMNPERVYNIALNRNDWHALTPYNFYRKIFICRG